MKAKRKFPIGLVLKVEYNVDRERVAERAPLIGTEKTFESYRTKHPARAPNLANQKSADELRQITTAEGLHELAPPPCATAKVGTPPKQAREGVAAKYLWVVASTSVPFALEQLPNAQLDRGYLSHTNLTGGAQAHSGGEMWFTDPSIIIMNGGSGRYPARSADELDDVAKAFRATGYKVAHMGWDIELNAPARYLRGDPQWL